MKYPHIKIPSDKEYFRIEDLVWLLSEYRRKNYESHVWTKRGTNYAECKVCKSKINFHKQKDTIYCVYFFIPITVWRQIGVDCWRRDPSKYFDDIMSCDAMLIRDIIT